MSKICDRSYKGNGAFTVKWINGVGCCPNCEQPAQCHNIPVEGRALFWALAGENGISSKAIAKHMTGISAEQPFGFSPPSDADDRRRCIRLLELIPEWITKLPEMVKYDAPDKKPEGFIINSSGIGADTNTWAKQIPLIMQEGKF